MDRSCFHFGIVLHTKFLLCEQPWFFSFYELFFRFVFFPVFVLLVSASGFCFWFLFSVFLLFTLFSCGGSDDDDSTVINPIEEVKSIKLSISSEYIELNTSAVFQVLSDKNKLLTSSCKFFVDNQEISGNTFDGDLGNYSVHATYKQLISESKNFNIIPKITNSNFIYKVELEIIWVDMLVEDFYFFVFH